MYRIDAIRRTGVLPVPKHPISKWSDGTGHVGPLPQSGTPNVGAPLAAPLLVAAGVPARHSFGPAGTPVPTASLPFEAAASPRFVSAASAWPNSWNGAVSHSLFQLQFVQ